MAMVYKILLRLDNLIFMSFFVNIYIYLSKNNIIYQLYNNILVLFIKSKNKY